MLYLKDQINYFRDQICYFKIINNGHNHKHDRNRNSKNSANATKHVQQSGGAGQCYRQSHVMYGVAFKVRAGKLRNHQRKLRKPVRIKKCNPKPSQQQSWTLKTSNPDSPYPKSSNIMA